MYIVVNTGHIKKWYAHESQGAFPNELSEQDLGNIEAWIDEGHTIILSGDLQNLDEDHNIQVEVVQPGNV